MAIGDNRIVFLIFASWEDSNLSVSYRLLSDFKNFKVVFLIYTRQSAAIFRR